MAAGASAKPVNMQLNDDTLLEEIKFTEAVDDQSDLALLDQCIILASWYVDTMETTLALSHLPSRSQCCWHGRRILAER